MTFARTKIQAPQPRATFIARGALHGRLAQALQTRRLVLVCAPAGFGKTTALANEITALSAGHALAWVAADPGDDLHRLLECMLTALEPYDPPWRTAPEALVARAAEATAEARRAIAAEILNTLDACDVPRGLIVFEDAHRITDRAFFDFLDLLLERLGARWTIAITTREDPPLSLARLRAADELAEFRQAQLQFSRGEARALAAQAGIDPELADRLFERTKGWPAGMRLAISATAGAGVPGAAAARTARSRAPDIDRTLFDYLVVEVADRLRPELRDFLSHVSVLPELLPERCAVVSGNPHAARLLDEIERLGLFVDVVDLRCADDAYDADGGCAPCDACEDDDDAVPAGAGGAGHRWGNGIAPAQRALRLHDLLRDALQRRLELDQPALLAALRERAAVTEPDPVRRVGLLLAAGKVEEAARLVARHGPVMLSEGSATSVTHLLKSFDPAYCRECPELQYVTGLVAWYYWNFEAMLAAMARAEAAHAARGNAKGEAFARAYRASAQVSLGRLAQGGPVLEAMRAEDLPVATRIVVLNGLNWLALETGALASIGPNVDEMVRLLGVAGRMELWYQTTPSARLPGLPGMGGPLQRHAEAMLRIARDESTPLRAMAYVMQARRHLWEGRFDEAERYAALARADAQWARDSAPVRAHILAHMTLWHAIRGERDEAIDLTRRRIEENQPGYGQSGIYHLLQFAARIAAICDDLAMIRDTLRRIDAVQVLLEAPDAGCPGYRRARPQRPLAGNVAWLEGRSADAIALWTEALVDEEAIDILSQAGEVRMRLALALLRADRPEDAAAVLQPVFALAASERAPGGVLLAAQALRELAGFDWGPRLPATQQALLREWWTLLAAFRGQAATAGKPEPAAPGSPAPRGAAPAVVEAPGVPAGLTRRETEVLERIAAGDSNKLIARAFDLSLHTVKRHVAHILDKLQLASRGQAAAWYRQHVS